MKRAICPGSFDPVTHGHLDVIERTTTIADEVVVAVGSNMSKTAFFSPAERVEMLRGACVAWPRVSVTLFTGLLVDFCVQQGISVISKGLRSGDLDYELQMAQMNTSLTGVDTVFWPARAAWSFVSSSLVREVALLGGDVDRFLPEEIARATRERVAQLSG